MSRDDSGIVTGDPFRRNYGQLTTEQQADMDIIKVHYEGVWLNLKRLEELYGSSRDLSVARTNLQDSCMWAVRAITKMEGQT